MGNLGSKTLLFPDVAKIVSFDETESYIRVIKDVLEELNRRLQSAEVTVEASSIRRAATQEGPTDDGRVSVKLINKNSVAEGKAFDVWCMADRSYVDLNDYVMPNGQPINAGSILIVTKIFNEWFVVWPTFVSNETANASNVSVLTGVSLDESLDLVFTTMSVKVLDSSSGEDVVIEGTDECPTDTTTTLAP